MQHRYLSMYQGIYAAACENMCSMMSHSSLIIASLPLHPTFNISLCRESTRGQKRNRGF